MLSDKFKTVILKLLEERAKFKKLEVKDDVSISGEAFGYGNSCADILYRLSGIDDILAYGNDKRQCSNYIRNGILSNLVINQPEQGCHEIDKIKCVDYFSDDSKDIINKILDAVDLNYVMDDKLFGAIDCTKPITTFTIGHVASTVLYMHFLVMITKIHFMWKKDPTVYTNDIEQYNLIAVKYDSKFTPMSSYYMTRSVIHIMFDKPNIVDIKMMIRNLESFVFFKYKQNNTKPRKVVPQKQSRIVLEKNVKSKIVPNRNHKFTTQELDEYKINGLKNLCIENGIELTGCSLRIDYIKALLKH